MFFQSRAIQAKIESAEKDLDQQRSVILRAREPGAVQAEPAMPPGTSPSGNVPPHPAFPTARQEAIARFESAWAIGRYTLERYWLRNSGVTAILLLSSIVSTVLGFAILITSAWHSIFFALRPHDPAYAAIVSGSIILLTAFAFFAVYCVVEHQSIGFSRALERMNAIGIAWYVLDTLPEVDEHSRAEKWRGTINLINGIISPTDPVRPKRHGQ